MKIVALVLLLMVLAGCTSQNVWTKPGSNEAQFNQSRAECKMHGQQAEASAIGYNGFLAGYENAQTYNACMQAKGWSLTSKDAARSAERSRIVWVKDPGYSYKQAHTDFAQCKQLNPNEDGVSQCMRTKGYVAITRGVLGDITVAALADGRVSKSVSNEAEADARRQKLIHIALSKQ